MECMCGRIMINADPFEAMWEYATGSRAARQLLNYGRSVEVKTRRRKIPRVWVCYVCGFWMPCQLDRSIPLQ